MSVRSAMPWPIRWILGAVMLGFSAAIGLWAFEFGKGIAGLDSNVIDELQVLRAEVALLKQEREKARTIANTSGSLLTAEKAAQEKTAAQLQQKRAKQHLCQGDFNHPKEYAMRTLLATLDLLVSLPLLAG